MRLVLDHGSQSRFPRLEGRREFLRSSVRVAKVFLVPSRFCHFNDSTPVPWQGERCADNVRPCGRGTACEPRDHSPDTRKLVCLISMGWRNDRLDT